MTTEPNNRWLQRTIQQVRLGGKSVRAFIFRVQRNAALAIWPAVVAAILGPLLIALMPAYKGDCGRVPSARTGTGPGNCDPVRFRRSDRTLPNPEVPAARKLRARGGRGGQAAAADHFTGGSMNSFLKQRADAVAAAIQKSAPVDVMLILLSLAYVAMPWHFVPIIGQVDLAVVVWFAWQNGRALFRKSAVVPPPLPPRIVKEVFDVHSA